MIKKINFTHVNPIRSKEIFLIKKEISKIINKKNFILGEEVRKFENNFSKLSKIKYSVGCASGTDALILALKSLELKSSDEVIVPAMTYISTGLSVLTNNNKLVYADINNDTGLISIDDIIKKITKKTKVIIPVNLYGQKVDLKKLRSRIGSKIFIVEDSAQSHFAFSCFNCPNKDKKKCCQKERNDRYADISCFSFYPAKNIGAFGDAGLVSTNNKKLYKKLLSLRNLGSVKKHEHNYLGINSRLDTIQAVVLNKKLGSILKLNNIRRRLALLYDEKLKTVPEIKITKTKPGSTRHLYIIRTKKRDSLMKHLLNKNILCQIHYPYALNKLKPFIKFNKKKKSIKNSEKWSNECLSLPMHPELKIKEINKVAKEIKNFF
jgi:dTDP-4-amino-4,6-dideoxygalactose transaminase